MGEGASSEPRTFTVYWCPRCKVQSERPYHFCEKGPALIPQMDVETKCEVVRVVEQQPGTEDRCPHCGEAIKVIGYDEHRQTDLIRCGCTAPESPEHQSDDEGRDLAFEDDGLTEIPDHFDGIHGPTVAAVVELLRGRADSLAEHEPAQASGILIAIGDIESRFKDGTGGQGDG